MVSCAEAKKGCRYYESFGADRDSFSSDTDFFGGCRSEVFQAARLAAGRRPVAEPEEVDSWTLNVATRLRHNCVIC